MSLPSAFIQIANHINPCNQHQLLQRSGFFFNLSQGKTRFKSNKWKINCSPHQISALLGLGLAITPPDHRRIVLWSQGTISGGVLPHFPKLMIYKTE